MIGIISDTHEQVELVKKATEIFKQNNVDFAVHCGDIISPSTLSNYQGLKMKFIFGNCDGERAGLNTMAKKLGFEEIQDEKEFEYLTKKFYVYHGTDFSMLNEKIQSNKYDYVLTGHTHLKKDEKINNTRVINPGALFNADPKTIALLDVEKDTLMFIEVKNE
jgi:uncharacterized protein